MTTPDSTVPDRALGLRTRVKKKRHRFVRPESWRYVRLRENWRNPRGLDSKVRLSIKGWPPPAGAGFGGPRATRGLHPSGYEEVLVHNVEQLREVAPRSQAARIAHTVGQRKRARILAEARKKKIVVLNLREARQAAEGKSVEEKEEKTVETMKKEAKEAEEAIEHEKKKPKERVKKGKRRTKEE